MLPRMTKGRSFKGAAYYLLHDKDADTDERVGWTQTLNLHTDDPDQAWRTMSRSAMQADELKRQNGIPLTGRKGQAVFHLSLSWHPEENPDQEHMMDTARSALKALGLENQQALVVNHTDEPQPHIHILASRIDQKTGKIVNTSYEKLTLSRWAQTYEKDIGKKVYCDQRVENNRLRDQGEYVKYRENVIESAWQRADNARAFRAGLDEHNYTLARGYLGYVVVDTCGKAHTVAKITGLPDTEVRQRLKSIDLAALPDANDVVKKRSAEREAWLAEYNRHAEENTERQRQNKINTRRSHGEVITGAWQASDTGRGFQAALGEHDYTLARGQRNSRSGQRENTFRYVVVTPEGDIHKPEKLIDGVRKKDIDARCQDVALLDLPDAGVLSDTRRNESERRDHQEAIDTQTSGQGETENRDHDTETQAQTPTGYRILEPDRQADTPAIGSREDEDIRRQIDLHDAAHDEETRRKQGFQDQPATNKDTGSEKKPGAGNAASYDAPHLDHLDRRQGLDTKYDHLRARNERELWQYYGRHIERHREEIGQIDERLERGGLYGWYRKLTGATGVDSERRTALEMSIADAQTKQQERRDRLERQFDVEKTEIDRDYEAQSFSYHRDHSADRDHSQESDTDRERPLPGFDPSEGRSIKPPSDPSP